jgi:hypothetical protein
MGKPAIKRLTGRNSGRCEYDDGYSRNKMERA